MKTRMSITVEQAREAILAELEPVTRERLSLGEIEGRVLARHIRAPESVPRFDNSSRDGYALCWEDLEEGPGAELEVVGHVAAGANTEIEISPGRATRITTGAPLPPGADTVVMREHTSEDEGVVTIEEIPAAGPGAWVRREGSYMREGEVVLPAGTELGGGELGLLASFGEVMVEVARRPVVAILSTGDELVEVGRRPGPAQIVNSNGAMLEHLVRAHGGRTLVFPIVPDHREATMHAWRHAIEVADIVLSSGGVSVGAHDEVRRVVDELTGGMHFWKIRMKPGKPLAFGTAAIDEGRAALIGLPGNPVSCFVCFHQFVRPALAKLSGTHDEALGLRRIRARLERDVTSTPKRRQYLSGRLGSSNGAPIFMPFPDQESGNLLMHCRVEALGIVEEGVAQMQRGDEILVELL